jgi:hypothetical protein
VPAFLASDVISRSAAIPTNMEFPSGVRVAAKSDRRSPYFSPENIEKSKRSPRSQSVHQSVRWNIQGTINDSTRTRVAYLIDLPPTVGQMA